jgi:uracil-DNA glycosylase
LSVNLKPLASIALSDDWKTLLVEEFAFDYMLNLKQKLIEERKNYQIFPPDHQIFNALSHTSVSQIKIVILGQDPYHGIGQANGLSFSVNKGNNIPPSLKNIFKELNRDVGCSIPNHGDLTSWAKQGVLLLNTSLTVRQAEPASHAKIGWEIFTNRLIEIINLQKENLVFLLWGNHAQSKDQLIDGTKHLVLKAAHPSPFSAHQGFFGCKHFSLANQYLIQKGLGPIEWQITD